MCVEMGLCVELKESCLELKDQKVVLPGACFVCLNATFVCFPQCCLLTRCARERLSLLNKIQGLLYDPS